MGKRIETVIKQDGADMFKFGHIELAITEEELKKVFDFGDILKVTIDTIGSFVMPFCRYYDEVKTGELILCTYTKGSFAVIARNYKSIGVELGLLEADTNDGNFRFSNVSKEPIRVTLELETKADRDSVIRFDDSQRKGKRICDFRMVGGETIKDNIIFRSSSPIDGRLSDCISVDNKAREAGIKSVINLADTKTEAEQFPDMYNTYCSGCKTACLNLPLDITSKVFKNAVYAGITFIANSEPPYLVFCSEGRDRTGLFAALLQSLCGTDLSRIVSDYTFSFGLFCEGAMNQEFLDNIEKSITENLRSILGVEKVTRESLQADTEKFLLSTGITYETICTVKSKFGVR